MLLRVCLLLPWTGKSWRASAVISPNVTEGQTTAFFTSPVEEAAGETLGTAALVLSVLALVLVLLTLLWLALGKASPSALANLANHQSAHPSLQIRGGPPKVSVDTDVYMNYSCSESYTNLDPTSMDSSYSSVS